MSFDKSTPGTSQRLNQLCLILFPSHTPHQNEMPSAHEPFKDASRRSCGSGKLLSLTVSSLRTFASHGRMKYSAALRREQGQGTNVLRELAALYWRGQMRPCLTTATLRHDPLLDSPNA